MLKKLMVDRRVDPGHKYSPTMGRYGFLKENQDEDGEQEDMLRIGDGVSVTDRFEERPAWDWPMKDPKAARFYEQS